MTFRVTAGDYHDLEVYLRSCDLVPSIGICRPFVCLLSVNSSLFNLPHWNYLANWNQILVECLEGSLQKTLILIWFDKKHGRYWPFCFWLANINNIFLWNFCANWNQTLLDWSLCGSLEKGFHSILIGQKNGCHRWFFFLIGKYTKIIFSSENWNQTLQEWCLEDPLWKKSPFCCNVIQQLFVSICIFYKHVELPPLNYYSLLKPLEIRFNKYRLIKMVKNDF